MIFAESEKKSFIGNCTDNNFIGVGQMFTTGGDFFMKVKDSNNCIKYVCLNSGGLYSEDSIRINYEYKHAIKINGKMEWWRGEESYD